MYEESYVLFITDTLPTPLKGSFLWSNLQTMSELIEVAIYKDQGE